MKKVKRKVGRPLGSKNKPKRSSNRAPDILSSMCEEGGDDLAPAIEIMSTAQATPHTETDGRPRTSVPEATAEGRSESGAIRRGSFREACQIICEPETRKEGMRHGWLGNTGSRKTTCIARLLGGRYDGITLIHDDTKRTAQYVNHPYAPISGSVEVVRFDDAPNEASVITVRGNPADGNFVEPEEIAKLAIDIARKGLPVRVVYDETDRLTTPGGRVIAEPEKGQSAVRSSFARGRALELSVIWSAQMPTRVPTELIDLSSTIGLCQLGPRAMNYLDERLKFEQELLDVVPTLEPGEFVLYQQGKNWNRTVYR